MNKQIISDGNVISIINIQEGKDETGQGKNKGEGVVQEKEKEKEKEKDICAICLGEITNNKKVVGLDCSHKFHIHCMKEQMDAGLYKCSLCRGEISDADINYIHTQESSVNDLESSIDELDYVHSLALIKNCFRLSFSCNMSCSCGLPRFCCSHRDESDIENAIYHTNTCKYRCRYIIEAFVLILLSPLILLYFMIKVFCENIEKCCKIVYNRLGDILAVLVHLFIIFFISCLLRPVFFGDADSKTKINYYFCYTYIITTFLYILLVCCCWCCCYPSRS